MSFDLLAIHLGESTAVGLLLAALIIWLRSRRVSAALRRNLWLLAFAKFAVPSAMLWSLGISVGSKLHFSSLMAAPVADLSRLFFRSRNAPFLAVQSPSHAWVTLLLLSLWFAGAALAFMLWLRRLQHCSFEKLEACAAGHAAFESAKHHLGVTIPVQLCVSKHAPEPLLIGIRSPVILLPEGLANELSPRELETVLMHELGHLLQRDNLVISSARVICSFFWFNPLLWWMLRELTLECEFACDEIVLARASSNDYASGILKATRFAVWGEVAGVSGIGGSEFRKRLEWIMSGTEIRLSKRKARSFSTAALAALVLIPVTGGLIGRAALNAQTLEKRKGVEFISASASSNSPKNQQILVSLKTLLNPNEAVLPATGNPRWDRWLNEDVVYLIKPEERAAFLALTSDEEREHFVAQFWDRRNPDPGSTTNAFKEEHYRRLAFSKRYDGPGVPGWQTDRGRIYIVLGPPDEIDSHPDQNREMWRYNERGTPDNISITFDISDARQ